MGSRFEASLDPYLAGIFVEKLCRVLKAAGFREALRIPEPHVIEFQRGSDVVTLQTGHPRSQRQWVMIAGETVDVNLLVGAAVKGAIVQVSDELLGSLSWVDRPGVVRTIESYLADALTNRKPGDET